MSPQIQYRPAARAGEGTEESSGGDERWASSWTYASAPSSVPCCRRSVAAALHGRGVRGDSLDTVALLVSELAGNAVEHAGAREFTVVLGRRGGRLRIEVRDAGPPLPRQRRSGAASPDLEATGGRGLFLVEALSLRWGVRPAAGGKCVWCEILC